MLPRNLVVGDLIAFVNEQSLTSEGRKMRYTFAGSVFFKRMQENNLYTIDVEEIKRKIEKMGLTNLFNEKYFRKQTRILFESIF